MTYTDVKRVALCTVAAVGLVMAGAQGAQAACKKYGAKATSGTEASAKWFVMETIVQQVSWGIWPIWVANGTTPGYTVSGESYQCTKGDGGVTCIGQATVCDKP